MPNRLQYNTVSNIVQEYASQSGLEKPQAFLGVVIKSYLRNLDLTDEDVNEAIIDGSNDGGIDAIYIDEPESGINPQVYIFQSKFHVADEGFLKRFPGNAMDKMEGAVRAFVHSRRIDRSYQNEELQQKLRDIHSVGNKYPKYVIVFCSNGEQPSEDAKKKFDDFLDEINGGQDYFSVEYLSLENVVKLVAPEQRKLLDTDIQFTGPIIKDDIGNVRAILGKVQGKVIAELREKNGDLLFDKNVRGYLARSRNEVNRGIYDSATGHQSPFFFYLNNGVTITCSDFTYSPTSESPHVHAKNIQIVNGGQTTNSLFEASRVKDLKEDVYVLVRLIRIDDPDLLSKIIATTNSQTAVNSRDLHSNDEIQRVIEVALRTKGFYYEARKDKHKNESKKLRIDSKDVAQLYYAAVHRQPAVAKNHKRELYGSLYQKIFNQDLKPEELLVCHLLYQEVKELNTDSRNEYSFVQDAALHTLAVLYSMGLNSLESLSDKDRIEKNYRKIIKATKVVVDEKKEADGDSYSHRRLFIDTSTLGKIEEVLGKVK